MTATISHLPSSLFWKKNILANYREKFRVAEARGNAWMATYYAKQVTDAHKRVIAAIGALPKQAPCSAQKDTSHTALRTQDDASGVIEWVVAPFYVMSAGQIVAGIAIATLPIWASFLFFAFTHKPL